MKTSFVSFLVLALGATSLLADEIHLYRGNSKLEVRVTAETYKEVEYTDPRIRAVRATLDASDVKEVIYDGFSSKYELALEAQAAGDYGKAVLMFEAAATNPRKNFWYEQQYGLFNAAECYRGAGQLDEALKAYERVISEVPDTKFYGLCYQRKAECYQAKGDKKKAEETYTQLRAEVASKGLSPRWDVLAEYYLLYLNEGSDPTKSLAAYEDLQKKAGSDYPDVANLARLRVGYVFIQQGKIDDARAYFQEIIDNRQASDLSVVAGAYLGRGSTYVNSKNASPEDFKKALFDFLRVIVHYGDQLGRSDKVAQALYWAGRCLEMRGDKESSDLASDYYRRVIKEYASTEWAKLALERG